jgi:hypothetical protein
MEKTENSEISECISKESNNHVIHLTFQKVDLNSKVKRKMKKYKITNFHFILDTEKEKETEKEKDINNNTKEENQQDIPKPKGKEKEENENSTKKQKHNNSYHDIIQKKFTESNNIPNNDILDMLDLQNEVYDKEEEGIQITMKVNENDNNKNCNIKEEKEEITDNIDNIDNSSKKCDEIIIISDSDDDESNINDNNNNMFHGKKTKRSNGAKLHLIDKEIQTCEDDDHLSMKSNPKEILWKLIKKYSYQMIFTIFLKFCSKKKNINITDDGYNKEIYKQLKKLIKDYGLQKVMQIILYIGNLRDVQINYSNGNNNKEKEMNIIEEEDEDEDEDKDDNYYDDNISEGEKKYDENNCYDSDIIINKNKNINDDRNEKKYDKIKIRQKIYDLLYLTFN